MSPELAATHAVAEWVLDSADRCFVRGNPVGALLGTRLAARTLARQSQLLVHPRIEANIRRLAAHVPDRPSGEDEREPRGCLHVLTQALPAGGHTAMATRWIATETSRVPHSVALLSQRTDVPQRLQAAVEASGGRVFAAPDGVDAFHVAAWLRSLARRTATRVVLHVDVDDLTAAMAFGVPGGPPVIVVNHAAHIFWAGISTADQIADCRGSVLEDHWTRHYRGAGPRAATIPIPLSTSDVDQGRRGDERRKVRRDLGIPDDALVLLTVGDTYKYAPLPHAGLDFVAAASGLLDRVPQAFLLAVGVVQDARWAAAAGMTQSRLRAVGRQVDVARFHYAADIYLEGFPFGSTTALLEAGLNALPAVLAPAASPPPFGTDGIAVDAVLDRPATVEAYVDETLRLMADPAARVELGRRLATVIREHHVGEGWNRHLTAAVDALPDEHRVYDTGEGGPTPTPESVHDFWSAFREECWAGISADVPTHGLAQDCLVRLVGAGDGVGMPARVWRANAPLRRRRRGKMVPLMLLMFSSHAIVPVVSRRRAQALMDAMVTLFRPDSRTSRLFGTLLPEWLW